MAISRLPVAIIEIVHALEREAANTDTDPKWRAASALRQMEDWDRRTLMCAIETEPQQEIATTRLRGYSGAGLS